MRGTLGLRVWLPLVVTGTGLLVVSFGLDAVAATSIADLGGLLYLLASPALYRGLRDVVGEGADPSPSVDGPADVPLEA